MSEKQVADGPGQKSKKGMGRYAVLSDWLSGKGKHVGRGKSLGLDVPQMVAMAAHLIEHFGYPSELAGDVYEELKAAAKRSLGHDQTVAGCLSAIASLGHDRWDPIEDLLTETAEGGSTPDSRLYAFVRAWSGDPIKSPQEELELETEPE